MSRYQIWFGYCYEEHVDAGDDLALAIAKCEGMRVTYPPPYRMFQEPTIFRPDNIDLDCSTGLTREERDQVEEAGL